MRRRRALAALVVAAVVAIVVLCAAATPKRASANLQKAADDYWAFLEKENLGLRIREGLPVDHLPDISLEHAEEDSSFARSLQNRLASISETEISHEEALTLAILRGEAREIADGPPRYWLIFPVTPYSFRNLSVHQVFSSHPFRSQADADHYLTLLAQYSNLIRVLEAKLHAQEKRGIRLPKEEIPLVVAVFAAAGQQQEKNFFWPGDGRLANLSAEDRDRFVARLAEEIRSRVQPAVTSLIAYLAGDYKAKASEAVGLSQYPSGVSYYRVLVRRTTTPGATPEEIHKIGLARVEGLNQELDAVRRRVGFAGSLAEFRRFLKTDARFFAKTPEEVGERLMAAQNRILPRIPEFFGITPRAPFGVQRLETSLEGAVTFGYYQVPTAQDPKGYYKFNGSNLNERSLLFAGALIAHELVPGHHFQINLQHENEGLPKFRRESFYTAFGEGWGEYASDLAGQMGMYETPYDRAGRIAMDLFLTSRLVVDTGMNLFGWPRAKAIAYMKENTLQSDTEIDTETLRYACDMPAQALAYKMGMRKFVELREKARAALGPKFDIRKFHNAVLGSGSLPLDVLEKHVDWFIAQEKNR